jgi:two-component system LytT family response regulator
MAFALSRQIRTAGVATAPEAQEIAPLAFRNRKETRLLATEDIEYIEAAGNYVTVHAGGDGELLRETMRALERRLPASRFVRIHRRWIVQVGRVEKVSARGDGGAEVLMRSGTRLEASRGGRARLMDALANAAGGD